MVRMGWRWVLLGFLRLLVLGRAQIRILSPYDLKWNSNFTDGVIMGSTSTFGAPVFGKRLYGKLKYSALMDYCEKLHVGTLEWKVDKVAREDGDEFVDVYLLRLDHTCSPGSVVYLAEQKGAAAVILIDVAGRTPREVAESVLPNNGAGDDVTIPSVLVSRQHGDILWKAVRDGPVVVTVELAWDIPQKSLVTVDMWMSSGSMVVNEFMERFKESAEVLAHKMQFVPRYYVFDLPLASDSGDMCSKSLASSQVQHCAPDPDGIGPVTGADVAEEDVRQLCLWHVTAVEDPEATSLAKYSQQWWDYVSELHHECPMDADSAESRFGSKHCSYSFMQRVGVSPISLAAINSCCDGSGAKYLEEQAETMAWSEQAIQINGWRYQGPFDPEVVLQAICSGFDVEPIECTELLSDSYLVSSILAIARHVNRGDAVSVRAFVLIIVAILVMTGVNCYLYRRHLTKLVRSRLREEVMLEVQMRMSQSDYTRLEGVAT